MHTFYLSYMSRYWRKIHDEGNFFKIFDFGHPPFGGPLPKSIPDTNQRIFSGVTPLGVGSIYTQREKNRVFLHVFGAEGAAKIFWVLFCKFWGNFLIKKQ